MVEIIIGIVALLIVIFAIVLITYKNKFSFAIVKIDEAESNIDVLLHKKAELLERTIPIVKKELKLEEFLTEMDFLEQAEINHFQLNDILRSQYVLLLKTMDENEKLFKSEALIRILNELDENEDNIIGSIKFYNDNVAVFNQLVSSFPAKLVAFFHHYRRKDFYSDESREMYEILNS